MKSSNSILLINPAFDPATAPACRLLIKVGLDSLSYAIINIEKHTIDAVFDEQECEDGNLKLAERLKNDPYLSLPYQETKVAFYTENTVAIPNELYDENNLSVYTQFFTSATNGNLYSQPHQSYGFTTIFSLTLAADVLFDLQTEKFQHSAGLLKMAEKMDGTKLLLDFTVGAVNVLFTKNKQVVLQQCYEIENPEEFNYYLILMINQLNIDTKETEVKLSGIIHEGDDQYYCLSKYFSSISFLPYENDLDQQILDDMPLHYYSSLLALNECGS